MKMQEITIAQLRRASTTTLFLQNYNRLMLGSTDGIDTSGKRHLLSTAIIFLNYGDGNLQRLGYRIILRYCILFRDYKPLYDVAINKGYIPVSKQLETKYLNEQDGGASFFRNYFSAYLENFRQDEIYLSYGQKSLIHLSNTTRNNVVIVAPTSYGKSELIIDKIEQNIERKICVIVPSKALLSQTKKRILNCRVAEQIGRIVTHSEMYRGDESKFVAVLTQERLLRLLERHPELSFDVVLVDEAHNLFKKDSRATLLAQVIMIIRKRNVNTLLNFFSPFISDYSRLRIPRSNYYLDGIHTDEIIKVERFYECDIRGDKYLNFYDQFLNSSVRYDSIAYNTDIEVINKFKADKNIVYLNKQRDIQSFALRLSDTYSDSSNGFSEEIVNTISDFLHPDYDLLRCIRSGIVYHHGGMPEIIRLYVESVFSDKAHLHFIVTSSTLLEGVNIPAEKIFLLTTKIGRRNFSKSEFKNLIGRVCRFSEVFNSETGRLEMLEPEIILIKSQYEHSNSNHQSFLEKSARVDLKLEDDVGNLLLKEEAELVTPEEKAQVRQTLEFLENIEPNTVQLEGMDYALSRIAKLCYQNNVYDFDIKLAENQLNANLALVSDVEDVTDANTIMELVYSVFLKDIIITNDSITRLSNPAARRFYAMILDWRSTGTSYKEMIAKFVNYWNSLTDKIIYFGRAWGETRRSDADKVDAYIDLAGKTPRERINLAIIKIKEEQDFFEFNLLKYVEILSDLGKLNKEFYERIKYGSSDRTIIVLLKNGFSIELAKLLTEKYLPLFAIDSADETVAIDPMLVGTMRENNENRILIFEMNYHIRQSI